MDVGKELGQQKTGQLGAARRQAAHDLGRVLDGELLVAGVDPLWREGQVKVLARLQARFLEDGQHKLLGRAGIGGALQDDQLAGLQAGGDAPRRLLDIRPGRAPSWRRRASARR